MKRVALVSAVSCCLVAVALAADPTLNEQFKKADVGKAPPGWTVAKTGHGEGSVWKVVEDPTAPGQTRACLQQTAVGPDKLFNLCVHDEGKYQDVQVGVALKAVAGKNDQGGGVVWRYRDANNYYVARINPLEENFRVYKVVNGKRTQLATKEGLKAREGSWEYVAVTMTGDSISCWLNGTKHLSVKDDTFKDAGQVGLWTKSDAQTRFDTFTAGEPGKK